MSIKIDKKIDFKNDEIKNRNQIFPKVDEDLPALPFICALIGSSGQGKSTTCINLLQKYVNDNAFDKVVLFSPTSVPDERTGLTADDRFFQLPITEMYSQYSDDVLEDVIERQKQEIKIYKDYIQDKKIWKEYLNDPTNSELEHKALQIYERTGVLPPECHMKRYPSGLIIMDDLGDDTSIKKTGKSKLNNFVCRIRHSLFSFITNYQNLTQCPSTIRKQVNLYIIFKTQDDKYLKTIYEEVAAGDMRFATFKKLFEMLPNRHDFLLINLKSKDPKRKYRINFDQYLSINDKN